LELTMDWVDYGKYSRTGQRDPFVRHYEIENELDQKEEKDRQ